MDSFSVTLNLARGNIALTTQSVVHAVKKIIHRSDIFSVPGISMILAGLFTLFSPLVSEILSKFSFFKCILQHLESKPNGLQQVYILEERVTVYLRGCEGRW